MKLCFGTKLEVNVLDEVINLNIPKGIQNGNNITIPNKGYIINNYINKENKIKQIKNQTNNISKQERGNLIVEIKIVMPKTITKEEEKLFKKLNQMSRYNPRNI